MSEFKQSEESKRQNWDEYHACFTGDCPHSNVNDCIVSLREAATEAGKESEANAGLLEECEKMLSTYRNMAGIERRDRLRLLLKKLSERGKG